MTLSANELKRYSRHLLLPDIGKDGQNKLKQAKVLLVGAGGLGSPQAMYLSAAGIGTLGIIDPDSVEFSNLQRQIIHFTNDVGKPKVTSAKEKINQINPEVNVLTYETRFCADNALEILENYDLVIDGTDNFPTRYLINDACQFAHKPFVYGGVFRFEGQCSVFGLPDGPCYRCFFQEPPQAGDVPSCAEAGVIGILPGIIGLLQSNEAIKLICNIGEPLKARLLIFDALKTQFREIKLKKNPTCPMCSEQRIINQLQEYKQTCTSKGALMDDMQEISVQELKECLDNAPDDTYILDVREQDEWDIAKIDGATLKPLSTLEENYEDIPKDQPVYVHCKMGGRSARAIEFLQTKGFDNLKNVTGGIQAWASEIDTDMPQY